MVKTTIDSTAMTFLRTRKFHIQLYIYYIYIYQLHSSIIFTGCSEQRGTVQCTHNATKHQCQQKLIHGNFLFKSITSTQNRFYGQFSERNLNLMIYQYGWEPSKWTQSLVRNSNIQILMMTINQTMKWKNRWPNLTNQKHKMVIVKILSIPLKNMIFHNIWYVSWSSNIN